MKNLNTKKLSIQGRISEFGNSSRPIETANAWAHHQSGPGIMYTTKKRKQEG
jgi:hypothetical protein